MAFWEKEEPMTAESSNPAEQTPSFGDLDLVEEQALVARLQAIRATIQHAGEKGRGLEYEVADLVRTFLPKEYGVSTGFIAFRTGTGVQLSTQLDVVIYDAIRGGPLADLKSCAVFPLESTLGYIEVKASLVSTSDDAEEYAANSIESCLMKNNHLRSMQKRYFHLPMHGSTVQSVIKAADWMPIRGFVFAFEGSGNVAIDPGQMAKRIAEFSKKVSAHFHGVFVGGSAFYETVPSTTGSPQCCVRYTPHRVLSAFKWAMLHSLSRFPRVPDNWTPAIDLYAQDSPKWETVCS
jgi:hypothetical protein